MDTCQIVLCPCPDRREAQVIAAALVEDRLAAAVNIIEQDSVFRWQHKITKCTEYLLIIKSRVDRYQAIEHKIRTMHSYQTPGIVARAVADGFAPYLQWIQTHALA